MAYPKIKIFIALSLAALAVIWLVTRPAGRLRVIFCDVGQGDGILVTQNYFEMIIDTGAENPKMAECLGRHLPFWDKTIEAAVITHEDNDHSGGLKIVEKFYKIDRVERGMRKGDHISAGEIGFLVLSPDTDWGDDNNNSTAGLLTYRDKRILLMADTTAEVEQKMVWRQIITGSADILKVSHHGSAGGTTEELLEVAKPAEAVISVGRGNKFGHPAKEVLEKLEKYAIKIRRTDLEGDIVYKF